MSKEVVLSKRNDDENDTVVENEAVTPPVASDKETKSILTASATTEAQGDEGSDEEGKTTFQKYLESRRALQEKTEQRDGFFAANKGDVAETNVDEDTASTTKEAAEETLETVPVLQLESEDKNDMNGRVFAIRMVQTVAAAVTAFWFFFCYQQGLFTAFTTGGIEALSQGSIGTIFSPVLFVWIVALSLQKSIENKLHADTVRSELLNIVYPSSQTEERVKGELSRLCRQAAQLTASTNLSLDAINKAREGLQAEMDQFGDMSKKAETNVVRLTSIMKDRMVKLDALTKALYSRTVKIGDKAQESGDLLEGAAEKLMGRVSLIENEMNNGVTKVLNASSTVQSKIDNVKLILGETVDGLDEKSDEICARLKDTANDLKSHEETLSGSILSLNEQRELLNEAISAQTVDLKDVTQIFRDAVEDSKENLRHDRDEFERVIELLSNQTEDAGTVFDGRIDDMSGLIENMRGAIVEVDGRMGSQMDQLEQLIERLDGQGESFVEIGKTTSRKLGDAMTAALSSADAISSAVRKGADTLRSASEQAVTSSSKASETVLERVKILTQSNETVGKRLDEYTALFDKQKALLDKAANDAGEQSESIREILEEQADKVSMSYVAVRERIEDLRDSFEKPLHSLLDAVSKADSGAKQIDTVMSTRITELQEMSDRAVEQAGAIRQALRGQSQELSSLSGQLTGNAKAINEHMEEQRQALKDQVLESMKSIKTVADALQAQVTNVSNASHKASEKIHGLETKISARYEEIQRGSGRTFDTLDNLNIQLGENYGLMEKMMDKIQSNVETIVDVLQEGASEITEKSENASSNTEFLIQRLSELSNRVEQVSTNGTSQMEDVITLFQEKVNTMEEGTESISGRIRDVSMSLKEQVEEINEVAQLASSRVKEVGKTLENQAQDVHLVTDQAALKVENIQKTITEKFFELGSSIGEAVTRLEEAGLRFTQCADDVDVSSERIEKRFVGAGQEARNEIKNMSEVVEHTALLASKSVQRVKEETQMLVQEAEKALSVLRDVSSDYADRSNELNGQMERSIDLSQDYSNKIRSQISDVSSAANEAADKILARMSGLSDKAIDVGDVAMEVAKQIDESSTNIEEQSSKLLITSDKVKKTLDETSQIYVKQSSLLTKASDEAAKQASKVIDADFNLKREAFFTSAKFVVESLHSLAVDFTRLLEGGEVPEKTWKAYQKGDLGAFTKRLLQMSNDIPTDKIREKYADDHEFRNYVQRYFRQYEDLFDQAAKTDHGDLLSSTFGSSDIGKLYQFLCVILGREGRGEDKKLIH